MNAMSENGASSQAPVSLVASRYHDLSCGHRVVGHEGKCRFLHGHNYRIHFHCEAAKLDSVGRVVDFSVIKVLLCDWLERMWDHKFLVWEMDPMRDTLGLLSPESLVVLPFNPTAENIADYLLRKIGPIVLETAKIDGLKLIQVTVEETRKCSASAVLR